jgi:hypothetical protein
LQQADVGDRVSEHPLTPSQTVLNCNPPLAQLHAHPRHNELRIHPNLNYLLTIACCVHPTGNPTYVRLAETMLDCPAGISTGPSPGALSSDATNGTQLSLEECKAKCDADPMCGALLWGTQPGIDCPRCCWTRPRGCAPNNGDRLVGVTTWMKGGRPHVHCRRRRTCTHDARPRSKLSSCSMLS